MAVPCSRRDVVTHASLTAFEVVTSGSLTASGAHPIAAVLADVDGTLITTEKVLTARTIEAVRRLHDRGVMFAITSGRPPRGMGMLVGPLDLRGPLAAFNGGIIVQPDLSILAEHAVAPDVTTAVIDLLRGLGVYVWIYREAEWYITDPHAPHAAHEASTVQFSPTVVPTYDDLLDRVVKIVGVSDDHTLVARCADAVLERFAARVSASQSQPYYLDVTHPDANKGVVVQRLSQHYAISTDQIATLGDGNNDVMMFERSGLSVAMGNAGEEVQRAATYVTASNEDEGFAKAIDEFILPRAMASAGGND